MKDLTCHIRDLISQFANKMASSYMRVASCPEETILHIQAYVNTYVLLKIAMMALFIFGSREFLSEYSHAIVF